MNESSGGLLVKVLTNGADFSGIEERSFNEIVKMWYQGEGGIEDEAKRFDGGRLRDSRRGDIDGDRR